METLKQIADKLAVTDEDFAGKLHESLVRFKENENIWDRNKNAWAYISPLSAYGMSKGMTGLD